jgi:hypothetical protein
MGVMSALPPVLDAALAALLLASIARAFFGPPPRDADRLTAGAWMLAGCLLLAVAALAGEAGPPRDVLAAAGVEAICLAGWRLRRADPGPPDGAPAAPPDGPAPSPDAPLDWDAFDRAREAWRPGPRDPAGVP